MSNGTETGTILYIEDDLDLLEEVAEELESMGHIVNTATDSAQAIAWLARSDPDLVVCDVILPDLNGFEFLEKVRKDCLLDPGIPVIFLSALSDRLPRLSGLRAGAIDYLTKPVDLDLLHLKISNTLALSRSLSRATRKPETRPLPHLSPRERDVLMLVGQGLQTTEIAGRLTISEHTVNQYIKSLYRKLEIKNRAEATRVAIDAGLI